MFERLVVDRFNGSGTRVTGTCKKCLGISTSLTLTAYLYTHYPGTGYSNLQLTAGYRLQLQVCT